MKFHLLLKILVLTIFYGSGIAVAKESISFSNLGVTDGLSQTTVYDIHQDKHGFMWFATQDGLNRYDGYQFKVFKHARNQPNSIGDSYVLTIYKDHKQRMWFGSNNGSLSLFNEKTETFTNYRNVLINQGTPRIDAIIQINDNEFWIGTPQGVFSFDHEIGTFTPLRIISKYTDNDINILRFARGPSGEIYAGSLQNGLFIIDPSDHSYTQHTPAAGSPSQSHNHTVFDVFIDSNNAVWISTSQGLFEFFPNQQQFKSLIYEPDHLLNIRSIREDQSGNLWLGSYNGIYQVTDNKKKISHFKHDKTQRDSLSDDMVSSIYISTNNVLWAGAGNDGISKHNINNVVHAHFHSEGDKTSVAGDTIWQMIEASDGSIWVATDQHGVSYLNRNTKEHQHLRHIANNPQSLASNRISAILESSPGVFWFGTFNSGITIYDSITETYRHFRHNDDQPQSLASDKVYTLFKDSDNQIWIGTNNGLDKYIPTSQTFEHMHHDANNPNSIAGNFVISLFEDSAHRLWIGTLNNGATVFDRKRKHAKHFRAEQGNTNSLSHNMVMAINEDSFGNMWFASLNGLTKYNLKTESYTQYFTEDGLPSEAVYSLIFTDDNTLWLSTNIGISKMDTTSETFENFGVKDGVVQREFNYNSYLKTHDGELYFGGFGGYIHFYPDELKKNNDLLSVHLTSLKVLNKSVTISEEPISGQFTIPQSAHFLERLYLDHTINLFSIEFSALHFLSANTVQYQYRLDDLDENWIDVDPKIRQAIFTTVPAGNYTLLVRAKYAQEEWKGPVFRLPITVIPAPWLSWWAYTIYLCIVFFAVVFYLYQRRLQFEALQRSEQKLSILNQELEQRVSLRTEELSSTLDNLQKTQNQLIESEKQASLVGVVSGVAHELNTPLGNILTATSNNQMVLESLYQDMANQKLTKSKFEEIKKGLETATDLTLKNANKAVQLVQSFKALSTHELTSNNTNLNLASVLRQITHQLSMSRHCANTTFNVHCAPDIDIVSSQITIEEIITQLVDNSLIHGVNTNSPNTISIAVTKAENAIAIDYSDSGVGLTEISPEQALEPFFTTKRNEQHTGLGLTIVFNKIAHRLKGTFTIKHQQNSGFHVTIELPLSL